MSTMSKIRSKRTRERNKSLNTWEQHLRKHGGDLELARSVPFTPPDYDKLEKERIKLFQIERVSSYTGKGKPLADYVTSIKKPTCTLCPDTPYMDLTKYGELPKEMFETLGSPLYLKDQIPMLQFTCPNCDDQQYKELIETHHRKRFVFNPNNKSSGKSSLTWSHLFSPSSSNMSPHTVDTRCPQCRASKELLCECHFTHSKVTNVPIELRSVPDFPKPTVVIEAKKEVIETSSNLGWLKKQDGSLRRNPEKTEVIETPRTEESSFEHGKRLVNTRYASCLPIPRNYNRKISRREWLKTKEYTQGHSFRPADWFEGK